MKLDGLIQTNSLIVAGVEIRAQTDLHCLARCNKGLCDREGGADPELAKGQRSHEDHHYVGNYSQI